MSSSARPVPSSIHLPNHLHKYITRNSEYLVRGGVCVEVRERHSLEPRDGHAAIEQFVIARVRWRRDGGHDVQVGAIPEVGDSLVLGAPNHEILTSAVRRIEASVVDVG